MENSNKETKQAISLIPKVNLTNWKPDQSLNDKIKESWGLEKKDE